MKALECKAQGALMNDLAFLYGKSHDFNEQEQSPRRSLVPSFYTFFEIFKYLRIRGQCARMLKRVNPGKRGPGRTVFAGLEQAFDETDPAQGPLHDSKRRDHFHRHSWAPSPRDDA